MAAAVSPITDPGPTLLNGTVRMGVPFAPVPPVMLKLREDCGRKNMPASMPVSWQWSIQPPA